MSKLLSRKEILEAKDAQVEKVEVPEWGGHVFVKGMTAGERDLYEESILERRGKRREANLKNARAKLVARTACNAEGELILNEADVDALGKKSSRALERVFKKSMELSGLSDDDMEELTKNSEAGQPGDSHSG